MTPKKRLSSLLLAHRKLVHRAKLSQSALALIDADTSGLLSVKARLNILEAIGGDFIDHFEAPAKGSTAAGASQQDAAPRLATLAALASPDVQAPETDQHGATGADDSGGPPNADDRMSVQDDDDEELSEDGDAMSATEDDAMVACVEKWEEHEDPDFEALYERLSNEAAAAGFRVVQKTAMSALGMTYLCCKREGSPRHPADGKRKTRGKQTKTARLGCPFAAAIKYSWESETYSVVVSRKEHNHGPDRNVRALSRSLTPEHSGSNALEDLTRARNGSAVPTTAGSERSGSAAPQKNSGRTSWNDTDVRVIEEALAENLAYSEIEKRVEEQRKAMGLPLPSSTSIRNKVSVVKRTITVPNDSSTASAA